MRKKYKRLTVVISLLIGLGVFSYLQNNLLGVTEITIKSTKIPSAFKGFKIVQLSDLHSNEFGENQKKLIKKVENINPNIVVITGDFIDSERYNAKVSLEVVKQLVKHYPVYFVTGNHEAWSGRFMNLEKDLKKYNVTVLRNEHAIIKKDGQEIYILGIDDPAFKVSNSSDSEFEGISVVAKEVIQAKEGIDPNGFKILLSHRPEHLRAYTEQQIDLVFTGHAHGGQIRIPFVGGLVAPDQGLLPKYTAGMYKDKDTSMIVSRGLGNSIIPQRIFNRPEIVFVQFK
ncbi:metallophosphoesterase [Bacillus sp. NPDC077411]|uniref:metallophosphoesterase n=1 Tax=Bacillus sp. NPDC077411 TaxID=3363947 RepID=UPI0037CAFC6F